MVWKGSTKLGCNTKPGPGNLMVCRYADTAANFGSKQGQVGYPTKSEKKKKECRRKFPKSKEADEAGGGSMGGMGGMGGMMSYGGMGGSGSMEDMMKQFGGGMGG